MGGALFMRHGGEMSGAFLAVDWGTSNRRVYRIEDARVVATERDDRGASRVARSDYPTEIAAIRARLGDLPMLLAGMVGSTIGWRTAPYAAVPADLSTIATTLDRIDERTAIVPGVAQHGERADVMRGEEVQLLGAVAAGLVPADALLCQPGTHCKWARIERGAIVDFETAMTGEIFALLRKHSILAPELTGEIVDGPAFRAGVTEGARRELASSLFRIRARGITGAAQPDAAAFASGLLIGADAAVRIGGSPIHVLAESPLGDLYLSAITILGGQAMLIDSEAAFVAGISKLWEYAQ